MEPAWDDPTSLGQHQKREREEPLGQEVSGQTSSRKTEEIEEKELPGYLIIYHPHGFPIPKSRLCGLLQ